VYRIERKSWHDRLADLTAALPVQDPEGLLSDTDQIPGGRKPRKVKSIAVAVHVPFIYELGPTCALVLSQLVYWADEDSRSFSVSSLAHQLHLSRWAVGDALKLLNRLGFIDYKVPARRRAPVEILAAQPSRWKRDARYRIIWA